MVYTITLPMSIVVGIHIIHQLLHLVQLDSQIFPHSNQLGIHLSPLLSNTTALVINQVEAKVKDKDRGWLTSMEILRIQEGGYMVGLRHDRGVTALVLPSPMEISVLRMPMVTGTGTGMEVEDTEVKEVYPPARCL